MTIDGKARNFSINTYVDDSGQNWNMRGDKTWASNGASGAAAAGNHPAWGGKNSRRRHPRYALFVDPATGRKVRLIMYTAGAFAALNATTTIQYFYQGLENAVTLNLQETVPERQPKSTVVINEPEPTATA